MARQGSRPPPASRTTANFVGEFRSRQRPIWNRPATLSTYCVPCVGPAGNGRQDRERVPRTAVVPLPGDARRPHTASVKRRAQARSHWIFAWLLFFRDPKTNTHYRMPIKTPPGTSSSDHSRLWRHAGACGPDSIADRWRIVAYVKAHIESEMASCRGK